MSRKKNTFERAASVAESGTSADCESMIKEVEELQSKEQAEANDVRPPGKKIYGGDGRVYGHLPAGPKYQAAAESDDENDAITTADCALEYDRLTARLQKLAELLQLVQKRRDVAKAEEELAAAPAAAKRAIEALDNALDRHEAALEAFKDARAEVREHVDALLAARKLDPDVQAMTVGLFYRTGVALAHEPPKRIARIEGGAETPERVTTPLFGHTPTAVRNATVLVDVPQTIRDRVLALMSRRNMAGMGFDSHWDPDTSESAVRGRLADWYQELVRRLSADDVEAAENLGPPEYKKGKPVFDGPEPDAPKNAFEAVS